MENENECCIQNCKQSTTNESSGNNKSKIVFHRFPIKDSILCAKWTHSIKILANQVIENGLDNLYICSEHFASFDYFKNKKLHPQAVPSIFNGEASDSDCENIEVLYSDIDDENILQVINENITQFDEKPIKLENIIITSTEDEDEGEGNNDEDDNQSFDSIIMINEDIKKTVIEIDTSSPSNSPRNSPINLPKKSTEKVGRFSQKPQLDNKRLLFKKFTNSYGEFIPNHRIAANPKKAKAYFDKLKLLLDSEYGKIKTLNMQLKKRNHKINELNQLIDELLKARLIDFGRCVTTSQGFQNK